MDRSNGTGSHIWSTWAFRKAWRSAAQWSIRNPDPSREADSAAAGSSVVEQGGRACPLPSADSACWRHVAARAELLFGTWGRNSVDHGRNGCKQRTVRNSLDPDNTAVAEEIRTPLA